MKRYNKYLLIGLLGVFFFSSCVEEKIVDQPGKEVIEGIPTEVTLSFSADIPTTIQTKAAISTEFEYQVNNLYVFIFNGNGKKEVGKLFTRADGLNITNTKTNGNGTTEGNVKITLTSGKKIVYAIANVPNESSLLTLGYNTEGEGSPFNLSEITSFDELQNVLAYMADSKEYGRTTGKLLMSGYLTHSGQTTPGECNIEPIGGTLKSIKLERVDAKVTFNIKQGTNPNAKTMKFSPTEYRLVNLPVVTRVVDTNIDGNEKDNSNHFFNTPFRNLEGNGDTFTFYVMENRNTAEGLTKYTDREMQEKLSTGEDDPFGKGEYVENGEFLHGLPYATYVQVKGLYYEEYLEDGQIKEKSADVIYTIHLGYINEDPNDFSVKRNHEYTYNVTINGVNAIEVEAIDWTEEDNKEKEPGAEGNVVVTDKYYQLDSHYEFELVTFNKDAIGDRNGFRIKTPFETGYYVPSELVGTIHNGQDWDDAKDFEWVKFARNNKIGNQYDKSKYVRYEDTKDGGIKLLNVKELLEELKTNDPYDENNEAVYTMYVMEYYYDIDPRTGSSAPQTFWKEFVNQPNREMHILCNTDISQDKNSTYTTSSIMISQRSIKSFYNVHNSNLATAWGIETINETGKLTPPANNPWYHSKLNKYDGRYNFYTQMKLESSDKWEYFISDTYPTSGKNLLAAKGTTSKERARALVSACLQRNIDLNKDGHITPDEMKWYPASIVQYTDIWMGKEGLPFEAYLYKSKTEGYVRYLSSDGKELYAEEGSSIGNYKFEWANSFPGSIPSPTQYEYRCVRDLGLTYDTKAPVAEENRPQSYVNYSKEDKKFILTYMNDNSIRDYSVNDEFVITDEFDPANKPYVAFIYKDLADTEIKSWKDKNDDVSNEKSPCAEFNKDGETGWRLPNQRELALMASRVDTGWTIDGETVPKYIWSRTSSSLQKKIEVNAGYGVSTNTGYIMTIPHGSGYTGSVRCVKDVSL